MIKKGDMVESKNPIKVTISKKVKGVVYKIEKQAFGTFVYFKTEEGELKCFKINQVIKIKESIHNKGELNANTRLDYY